MRILTRYIIRELVGPTLLGFFFYTFVILIRNLFDFAEMIIKRSLPAATVVELLALSLPHIVVLTIPMSLLFGILIAVGRLSADSEIIAMRAAGLSTATIYRPVFYFSFAIFLVNLYLINVVLPRGNAALQALKTEIFTGSAGKVIKPRVFFDEYTGLVLYVNDIDQSTGKWKGVFVSSEPSLLRGSVVPATGTAAVPPPSASPTGGSASDQTIIIAKEGSISFVPETKQLWLDLREAETHVFSPARPERYDRIRNASQQILLLDRYRETPRLLSRSLRELTLPQLLEQHEKFTEEYDRRMAQVEIHKKFSIPFACLAFGIIGLPLGITNRRGGKSSGFTLSIAIILLYYVALNNGEDMARTGVLHPAIAMWLPNIVLTATGIYLLRRANQDGGGTAARRNLMERLKFLAGRLFRPRTRGVGGEEQPSLLARLDFPFPNTIDRYVLREFVKILLMVLVSTAVLFVIVDYTELAKDISRNNIGMDVVASYYRYYVFQALNWTLPISVLLATLVTFGIFSKNNEITAIKSNGVSLYRVALPVIAIAGVVTVLAYLLLDFVLPYSNDRMSRLRDQIQGEETPSSFTVEQRQWLFGKGRYLFNFMSLDRRRGTLSELQVLEFDPNEFRLTRRTYASRAEWNGSGWAFSNGWIRSFAADGDASFVPFTGPLTLQYQEPPEYFALEAKRPDEMTYTELRRYIADLRRSGYAADELLVDLYKKTSWPFISLVMALIALPFAFRIGKRGALYGIGIALGLAFLYWAVFGVFTKFGEVGNLPAVLSAWSANILFAIAAVYLFLRVET